MKGSSQLRGHPNIKPMSIRNLDIVNHYGSKYMYLGMIKFIHQVKNLHLNESLFIFAVKVKTGPFNEHSQILDSIANTIHWEKINQGMMKMYKV